MCNDFFPSKCQMARHLPSKFFMLPKGRAYRCRFVSLVSVFLVDYQIIFFFSSGKRRGSIFFIVSVVYKGKQVKLLFTVCFTLSQSKDIFSYIKTTVYSCYSCSRQEGALFFSSSQLSTKANIRFPLKYTVSLVSVFLVDYQIIFFFSSGKTTVYSLFHSVTV